MIAPPIAVHTGRRRAPSLPQARRVTIVGLLALSAACTGRVQAPGGGGNGPMGGSGSVSGKGAPVPPTSMPTPQTGAPPVGQATDLSTTALADACKTPTVGRARLWRLSREQLRATIKAALDVDAADAQLAAFNDGTNLLFRTEADSLTIHKADTSSWALSVAELAKSAATKGTTLSGCSDLAANSCAATFVDRIGTKLFRRTLSADEKTRYAKLYSDSLKADTGDTTPPGERAAQATLAAMLQSPYFLYRTELGVPVPGKPGLARLTSDEIASALSYTLWQGPPDEALLAAARAGDLSSPDGVRRQAVRMVGDAKFAGFFGAMLADLTHASKTATREGADMVPDADTLLPRMQSELDTFIAGHTGPDATLADLLTARRLEAPAQLASYRNLATGGTGDALIGVDLPSEVAAGLLAVGAVNFANAGTDHPSPVRRGLTVRERLLCSPVPSPPPDVKQEFATGGDLKTNRQRYERTMSPATCNACHRLFNPIGYAFEAFDENGRYRSKDSGESLNLSGSIIETRDANGSFANLAELGELLSKSQQVAECFALQGFRYVSGRLETPGDLCYVAQVHQAWQKSGGKLRTLAVELVTADSFVYRTVE